jgi:hypothetical protein
MNGLPCILVLAQTGLDRAMMRECNGLFRSLGQITERLQIAV